jgi:hypothetical protein
MFENVRHAWNRISVVISLTSILLYMSLRYLFHSTGSILTLPLWIAIITGGLPLLYDFIQADAEARTWIGPPCRAFYRDGDVDG